jgi:hypothetical protein
MLRPVPLLLEVSLICIEARSSGCEMIGSGVPPARGVGRGDGDGFVAVFAETDLGAGTGVSLSEKN